MASAQSAAAPSWLPPGIPGVQIPAASGAGASKQERRAAYRPLLLDSQGREIDEKGALVQREQQVRTLAANAASAREQLKKENPYLAHRQAPKKEAVPGTTTPAAEPTKQVSGRLDIFKGYVQTSSKSPYGAVLYIY
jgi:hypothetical protein